jgi:hypothetical protein
MANAGYRTQVPRAGVGLQHAGGRDKGAAHELDAVNNDRSVLGAWKELVLEPLLVAALLPKFHLETKTRVGKEFF